MAYTEHKNETYTIDGLTKGIEKILKEYGVEVNGVIDEVVPEIGNETAKRVKQEALNKGLKRKKGGKHYANGWRAMVVSKRYAIQAVVYNVTKPQLTHLLENGHLKVNGVDKVDGIPHIAPVNEWAENEVVERIEKRLSE